MKIASQTCWNSIKISMSARIKSSFFLMHHKISEIFWRAAQNAQFLNYLYLFSIKTVKLLAIFSTEWCRLHINWVKWAQNLDSWKQSEFEKREKEEKWRRRRRRQRRQHQRKKQHLVCVGKSWVSVVYTRRAYTVLAEWLLLSISLNVFVWASEKLTQFMNNMPRLF